MEREYYDYNDWQQSGGDPSYGGAVSPPPSYQAPPPANVVAPPVAPPQTTQAPPTTGGPQIGDRRDVPGGRYIEEWNGTTWVRYDKPGSGRDPNEGGDVPVVGQSPGQSPVQSTGQFDYGRPMENQFSPYVPMAPFVYSGGPLTIEPFTETFKPSSWADAENEPGYAEAQARLAKMIQNTAAYRGVLRSGATIGDLGTYLGQNKSQNFQQFDARNFRNFNSRRETWAGNAGVKADTWSRNVGNEQFAYGQAAQDNDRGNNYRFNTENANFNDLLSRWTTLVNSATSLARPV